MKRFGIFLILASLLLGLAVSVRPVSAGPDEEDETVVSTERSGGSSDEKAEKPEKGASHYVKKFIIAAVIGLIIAWIATGSMTAGMKNVHKSRNAANYVRKESFKLRVSDDRFLRSEEKRTRKQTNS